MGYVGEESEFCLCEFFFEFLPLLSFLALGVLEQYECYHSQHGQRYHSLEPYGFIEIGAAVDGYGADIGDVCGVCTIVRYVFDFKYVFACRKTVEVRLVCTGGELYPVASAKAVGICNVGGIKVLVDAEFNL